MSGEGKANRGRDEGLMARCQGELKRGTKLRETIPEKSKQQS